MGKCIDILLQEEQQMQEDEMDRQMAQIEKEAREAFQKVKGRGIDISYMDFFLGYSSAITNHLQDFYG